MSIDQGGPKRYALGIDFGTSNTVAVARWPDGRARPILVDGSPLLPSAVFADSDGNLLVGRDAVHSARVDPARFEPNPKRRVDDGLVLLGEREFEVVELISAVLARVAEEWHRAVGPYRPEVTLTCPASWGAARRTLLADAATHAGLEGARLVAEPVAAATYFAQVLGRDVPIGSVVMVHDFGAGTFDTSVVARTSSGFEVLAVDGRDDLGGLDVDAAIVEHLQTDDWARLMEPATVEERRARRQLWDDVRIAKERLSRAQSADFVVPLLDIEAHFTREELETVARPVLEQTVQITQNLLRWADLPDGRLAGVFLVGGASRIPLVATLLHRALGDPPVVIEQPELVVAEGSILAGAALLTTEPAAPGPTEEMRLPSKYLALRVADDVADLDDGPTRPAPQPALGDRASAGPTALMDRPTVIGDRSTALVDRPTVIGDRPTVMGDRPTFIGDRPTVIGDRPATTPVPAIPSEQGPEVDGPPVDDLGTEKLPDSVIAAATRAAEPETAKAVAGPTREVPSRAPAGQPHSQSGQALSQSGQALSQPGHAHSPSGHALSQSGQALSQSGQISQSGQALSSSGQASSQGGQALPQRKGPSKPPAPDSPPHLRPPVDPWPHAVDNWRPDPDATVATSPSEHGGRTPVPTQSRQPGPPPRGQRSAPPVVAHARPLSPAVGSARPVSGPARAAVAPPQPAPEPERARRPRRRSRLGRAIQILLSIIVMITVPIVALVLAYGYGNAEPIEQDAIHVFEDIWKLLGL